MTQENVHNKLGLRLQNAGEVGAREGCMEEVTCGQHLERHSHWETTWSKTEQWAGQEGNQPIRYKRQSYRLHSHFLIRHRYALDSLKTKDRLCHSSTRNHSFTPLFINKERLFKPGYSPLMKALITYLQYTTTHWDSYLQLLEENLRANKEAMQSKQY